jgi:serine/threonine protein kinase
MGTVFEAERADGQFAARVAIKVLREFPTAEGRARLRQERQILAELDHAHIARLLDGGETDDGQPYIVMEYVPGLTLAQWLRATPTNREQRLVLFGKLVAAVAHAHQRLVIHRDLKPTNVMVREDGEPKLLDFGVSKLIDLPQFDASRDTSTVVFTPGYASPEQRAGRAVTTATDVYALGVLLAEMLDGRRPSDAPPDAAAAWPAVVVDAELRGVIRKAMAADPAQRYVTADALAADLERYRDGLPLEASADTRWYRARKFVARHRVGVAIALLAAVGVAGFVVRLDMERQRALAAEQEAKTASQRADQRFRVLADVFAGIGNRDVRGAPLDASALLDRARVQLETRFADDPESAATLQLILADVFFNAERFAEAADLYQRGLARGGTDLNPNTRGSAERSMAMALMRLKRFAEAALALDRAARQVTEPPSGVAMAELALRIEVTRYSLARQHSGATAAPALDELLSYADRHLPPAHRLRGMLLMYKAHALELAAQYQELIVLRRAVLANFLGDPEAFRRDIGWQRVSLARALRLAREPLAEARAQLDAAEADFEAEYGTAANAGHANVHVERAAIELAAADLDAAEASWQEGLKELKVLGRSPNDTQWLVAAEIAGARGAIEQARERFEQARVAPTAPATRNRVTGEVDRSDDGAPTDAPARRK